MSWIAQEWARWCFETQKVKVNHLTDRRNFWKEDTQLGRDNVGKRKLLPEFRKESRSKKSVIVDVGGGFFFLFVFSEQWSKNTALPPCKLQTPGFWRNDGLECVGSNGLEWKGGGDVQLNWNWNWDWDWDWDCNGIQLNFKSIPIQC